MDPVIQSVLSQALVNARGSVASFDNQVASLQEQLNTAEISRQVAVDRVAALEAALVDTTPPPVEEPPAGVPPQE